MYKWKVTQAGIPGHWDAYGKSEREARAYIRAAFNLSRLPSGCIFRKVQP